MELSKTQSLKNLLSEKYQIPENSPLLAEYSPLVAEQSIAELETSYSQILTPSSLILNAALQDMPGLSTPMSVKLTESGVELYPRTDTPSESAPKYVYENSTKQWSAHSGFETTTMNAKQSALIEKMAFSVISENLEKFANSSFLQKDGTLNLKCIEESGLRLSPSALDLREEMPEVVLSKEDLTHNRLELESVIEELKRYSETKAELKINKALESFLEKAPVPIPHESKGFERDA